MTQHADFVISNPKLLAGAPAFAGTRVPAESLFDYLKRGRRSTSSSSSFRRKGPAAAERRQNVARGASRGRMARESPHKPRRGVSTPRAVGLSPRRGLQAIIAPFAHGSRAVGYDLAPLRGWAGHPVLRLVASFFVSRPGVMRRTIRAPDEPPRPLEEMMKKAACPTTGSAADFLPGRLELPVLAKAAQKCQGCGICCNATQTVFGEGPADAACMFVGEQPGDQEDRAGKPFVGPAGTLLGDVMRQAGIPREEVYVTNAVKHFKWEPRGKRRIHAKPSAREVAACRPWLEAEIKVIKPQAIVCLGATAAQSLLGPGFRLTQHRGEAQTATPWAPWVLATVHPSSLLRIPDHDAREQARAQFVDDLRLVAKHLKAAGR